MMDSSTWGEGGQAATADSSDEQGRAAGHPIPMDGRGHDSGPCCETLRLVPGRPFGIVDVDELADARAILLQAARSVDRSTVEQMLDVALTHLEEMGPDAGEGYLAVESTLGALSPEAERMARACWARRDRLW